jgi:hypothetical protein
VQHTLPSAHFSQERTEHVRCKCIVVRHNLVNTTSNAVIVTAIARLALLAELTLIDLEVLGITVLQTSANSYPTPRRHIPQHLKVELIANYESLSDHVLCL